MILYHGSAEKVEAPEIREGRSTMDFGAGFYTTSSFEQAMRWARIKMRRCNTLTGYVSVYEFDLEKAQADCIVRKFDGADMDWLLFVTNNRKGVPGEPADLHIGPAADDNVYRTVNMFETGVYDAEYTIRKLRTEVLHDQWAFHSDRILSYCRFIRAVKVEGGYR